jgi:autotransporter-associated beta strand protein
MLSCAMVLTLSLAALNTADAGSATWNLNPTNNQWYTASNWTPATVPNSISDTATFGASNVTTIYNAPGGLLANLGTFAFNQGASAYSINFDAYPYPAPVMIGAGVMNDSGVLQTFVIPTSSEFRDPKETNNTVSFINSATAGTLTQWTVGGSFSGAYRPAELMFNDSATGASATFIVGPGGSDIGGEDGDGYGGILDFTGSSTADHATINVNGGAAGADHGSPPDVFFTDDSTAANATITTTAGTIPLGYGGVLDFFSNSTAASATITNQGGAVSGARPGETTFWDTATAGDATVIANAGTNGASGGLVRFLDSATGGTARSELFGNGSLDISFRLAPGVIIGSVKGDGLIFLGANNLTIGSNNLSTTFAGVIQDSGSVTKIGAGKLTLSGANTYSGGTIVNAGSFLVANRLGSGTGTGPVQVNAGKLGGTGRIAGSVTIGGGSGPGAFLTPGTRPNIPATLTIGRKVRFKADGTFHFEYKSGNAAADKVVGRGVTIETGAQFFFGPIDSGTLPLGTVFTAIDNTAATPIAGTFANVPDGSVITIGNNTFQANYEGGNGNNLTLTVMP